MTYLATDSDGTECIYQYELERHIGLATNDSSQMICYEDFELKRRDFWTMKPNNSKYPYANRIFLPLGSIKKLIGKDLTWEDEPYILS